MESGAWHADLSIAIQRTSHKQGTGSFVKEDDKINFTKKSLKRPHSFRNICLRFRTTLDSLDAYKTWSEDNVL